MTTDTKFTPQMRITALAETFPCLRGAPGVMPWNALELLQWARVASHGEVLAVKFVLGVWNPGTNWEKIAREHRLLREGTSFSRFDLFEAINCWDDAHIAAMAAWIRKPFFL